MTTLQILKRYFGYDSFRNGQEALINGVLEGKDVLGIMPTGAGKSICFQIPALLMDGVTLIVSPLISLMKDQVNALTQSGVAAAFINSSLTPRQMDKAMENARRGMYKLIYVAPERLPGMEMASLARSIKISMLTIDEAHCISQWGQDFRPSYARIPEFIAGLPSRPVVSAFTATATPRVRDDIVRALKLCDPKVLVTGFDRKNLYFDVRRPKNKYSELTAFLKDRGDRSGIVYCAMRKTVEDVCDRLRRDGVGASRYHAGLTDQERHGNQDDFLYDRAQVMVATNAFGMGIDKSNVSFVVHYNMPKDIESYYQEAGRAGRDGEPADCVLLYSGQDVRINRWMIENDKDAQYSDPATERMIKERNLEKLRQITYYCTGRDCLRKFILKYFGEKPPMNCGNCGVCTPREPLLYDDHHEDPRRSGAARRPFAGRDAFAPASRSAPAARPVDKELYDILRRLRNETAKEQSVPAYVVFADSSLVDMCVKLPRTREAFLDISGVGDMKLDKYGNSFLAAINGYLSDNGVPAPPPVPIEPPKTFDPANVEASDEPVNVSTVADRINCAFIPIGRPKTSGQRINEWLVAEGYMEVASLNGQNARIPTAKGTELGITCLDRTLRGENVRVNMLAKPAQELIIKNALKIEAARRVRR